MAKVAFTKLGLKVNQEKLVAKFNEQEIEVEQYLPINEKLALISRVLNLASDENNFANPIKLDIYLTLEILFAYTNINFTDKQKEDITKLYDLVTSSGLVEAVFSVLPQVEYDALAYGLKTSAEAIYTYRNSIMGILDIIGSDYSNLNLDATELQKKIGDPENLALLKSIMTKLG